MKALCENCKRINRMHEFQDKLLGQFIRWFNKTQQSKTQNFCRCTVCGAVQEIK